MEISIVRAMIVGGASGMARATAERIAASGGRVVIIDRPGTAGPQVAAAIGATFLEGDAFDFDGIETVIAAAVEALGGLDAAVNTAGGGASQPTLSADGPHDLASFREVVDHNLVATFNLNRLQALHMSTNEPNDDGERGVIVNTASIAAFEGQIGQVAYAASKAAIAAMSLAMARDLGTYGIRVNAIAPSVFDTGATKPLSDEFKNALTDGMAFPKRMGKPEEYARLAVAIIENPMLNGGTVRLDGGLRLGPT